MTWPEAKALARAGTPVRRSIWASNRRLVYTAGGGSTRAVAVIETVTNTATASTVDRTVVTQTDWGETEYNATDWVQAS